MIRIPTAKNSGTLLQNFKPTLSQLRKHYAMGPSTFELVNLGAAAISLALALAGGLYHLRVRDSTPHQARCMFYLPL